MENRDAAKRAREISEEMKIIAGQHGWKTPEIIAVTKTVEPERIRQLDGSGITKLGENRVQEMLKKIPEISSQYQFLMIGRLQNNKVKSIIDKVSGIQSLDREDLAQEIDRRAQMANRRMPVLIQINIGNESQKGGIPKESLLSFARRAASLPGLEIRGLMAVMPDWRDPQALAPLFREMRALFERLRAEAIEHTRIEELSMGMSGDYALAAAEGATHVRLGSALFGSRG